MAYPDIFRRCIDVVLDNEGGYVNNHSDPGGETNFGIAKRFYPNINIKTLTKERAIEIFYNDYWISMKLESILEDELILHVFDHGVNVGPKTSIKILQRLVGVKDDGLMGSKTLRAIREYNGDVVEEFVKRRKLFYVTLVQNKPELRVFIKGWLNRIEKTKFKS